jgi:DNA-binding MarR family transcriptional regulator
LSLLSAVTQQEREALMRGLAGRGFPGVMLPAVRLLSELREGPKSVQALADATGTTKQFCGREVQKLDEAGLASTDRSRADKRVVLVELTAKGGRLLDAVKVVKRELDGDIARRVGAANAKTLRALLTRLLAPPGA